LQDHALEVGNVTPDSTYLVLTTNKPAVTRAYTSEVRNWILDMPAA